MSAHQPEKRTRQVHQSQYGLWAGKKMSPPESCQHKPSHTGFGARVIPFTWYNFLPRPKTNIKIDPQLASTPEHLAKANAESF